MNIQIENHLANQFELLIQDADFEIINITERDFFTTFEIETSSYEDELFIEHLALTIS